MANSEPFSVPEVNSPRVVQSYNLLTAQNAALQQALAQSEAQLQSAQLAIRHLAAWTLQERTRLTTEAQHQHLLLEDYEAVLRQRDEQVVYLLASNQEARLDHTRTLVREGKMMGRPVAEHHVRSINQMRAQIGLRLIDQFGAVQDASVVQQDMQKGVYDEQIAEDEEAYSPPDSECLVSIDAQVDELIAEEKGRLAG